jgi:hypothetical protein
MREVASGEFRTCFASQRQQAVEEAADPLLIRPFRESHGEQTEARFGSHGGDIAQSAREGFVADLSRGVGFAAKMHVFDQHVSGEDEFLGPAARTINGAIVADAKSHARGARFGPDPVDDFLLRRHAALYRFRVLQFPLYGKQKRE